MSKEALMTAEVCNYQSEWQRTNPDLVVYKPETENEFDSVNQHLLVTKSQAGSWLAFWTRGADEGEVNQSVVMSRSTDRGASWSEPTVIGGPQSMGIKSHRAPDQRQGQWHAVRLSAEEGQKHAGISSWGFPIVAPKLNRVYCFFFKCNGIADFRYDIGGIIMGRFSDDDGITWSDEFELNARRTAGDNPDPGVPVNWIVFQVPYVTSRNEVIAPFTCWNSAKSLVKNGSDCHLLRFDNILTEPDPARLKTTTLPESGRWLRHPCVFDPTMSFCEEPVLVELSDGRFFCAMRTNVGYIVFSISTDRGHTWTQPAPLYRDGGNELMLNPVVPCPLWKLQDGRFLLQYCNNNGDANGGEFPCGYNCWRTNRYPSFLSIGREDLNNPRCPIRFGPPKMFVDTQGAGIGPGGRTDAASYGSLLEHGGERVLFYPDRKHWLLGRYITDEWLSECDPG